MPENKQAKKSQLLIKKNQRQQLGIVQTKHNHSVDFPSIVVNLESSIQVQIQKYNQRFKSYVQI